MQIQITRRVEKSKVKKNSWTVKLDHLCKETSRHVYLSNGPMWNTLINNKKKANSQEKTSDLKIENFPKLSQKMWKNIKTEHYT